MWTCRCIAIWRGLIPSIQRHPVLLHDLLSLLVDGLPFTLTARVHVTTLTTLATCTQTDKRYKINFTLVGPLIKCSSTQHATKRKTDWAIRSGSVLQSLEQLHVKDLTQMYSRMLDGKQPFVPKCEHAGALLSGEDSYLPFRGIRYFSMIFSASWLTVFPLPLRPEYT